MTSNIFVPKRINVGFNKRADTYTQKLAYIIYWDEKGKLRKETSWEGWRDKDIPPEQYDNTPTSGFVLNKNVGGYAHHWDARKAYIRIYDPRGFEFEITLPNLLYILENTNCIKGKGLEGEFVYGWDGKDLVLIPVSAPEYVQMQEMTSLVYDTKPLGAKDLKVGFTYLTAKGERFVYMGKSPKYRYNSSYVSYSYLSRTRNSFEDFLTEYPDAQRDLSCYYKKYVATIPSKPHYWFIELKSGSAYIECYASVPKKFYNVEDIKPHKDYHIFEEALSNYSEYTPIDYSRCEHIPQDIDEFREKMTRQLARNIERNWYTRETYYTLVDGVKRLCAVKIDGTKSNYYFQLGSELTGETSSIVSSQLITLDELCTLYPPIESKLYLTNGKEYKCKWSKVDGYEE